MIEFTGGLMRYYVAILTFPFDSPGLMCYSVVGTCSLLVTTQSLYVLPLDALLRRGRLITGGSMRYFVAIRILLF